MNILINCININLRDLKISKKDYTGKQLYNLIIPSGINVIDSNATIKDGDILSGVVKNSVNKNIINDCWDRYGPKITADYITNIQRLIVNFILYQGFSVGLKDCYINKDVKNKVTVEVEN